MAEVVATNNGAGTPGCRQQGIGYCGSGGSYHTSRAALAGGALASQGRRGVDGAMVGSCGRGPLDGMATRSMIGSGGGAWQTKERIECILQVGAEGAETASGQTPPVTACRLSLVAFTTRHLWCQGLNRLGKYRTSGVG
jgi:hypothetical protein